MSTQIILTKAPINVNGINQGNIIGAKTIDVNLTDGVNPVTPNDVTLVGTALTIEVPAGGGGGR